MKIFKRCKKCNRIVIFDVDGYCEECHKRMILKDIVDIIKLVGKAIVQQYMGVRIWEDTVDNLGKKPL